MRRRKVCFETSSLLAIYLQSAEVIAAKIDDKQILMRTALNRRSAEVWRQTGREREFPGPTGAARCGGFCSKPMVIGDFSAAKSSGERWSRKDWRRERNWDPTVSRAITLDFAALRVGRPSMHASAYLANPANPHFRSNKRDAEQTCEARCHGSLQNGTVGGQIPGRHTVV